MQRTPILVISLAVLLALLAWSGWQPYDRTTWLLEVFPIFVLVPVLLVTYSRVPLGFQIAEALGLHRNPYDQVRPFSVPIYGTINV